jgi:hypothetical protein
MYPLLLQPQHMGCPFDRSKHVWQKPQVIAIASLAPSTKPGAGLS